MTMQVFAVLTPAVLPQTAIGGQPSLTEYPEGQQQNYQDDLTALLASMDAALAQLDTELLQEGEQSAQGTNTDNESQDLAQSMLPQPLLFDPVLSVLTAEPQADLYQATSMPLTATESLLTTQQASLQASVMAVAAQTTDQAAVLPLAAVAAAALNQPVGAVIQSQQPLSVKAMQAGPARVQGAADLALAAMEAEQQPGVMSVATTAVSVANQPEHGARQTTFTSPLSLVLNPALASGQNPGTALQQLVADVSAQGTTAVSAVAQSATQSSLPVWQADPLPTQSQHWGQRLVQLLADKVDLQLGLNVNKAMIRLDPPSLGSIELSVQLDGDRLTVQMHSSNAQLRDAMGQGLDLLRASLQQKLGSEVQIDLRMGSETSSQQQQQHAGRQFAEQTEANFYPEAELTVTETSQPNRLNLVNQLV